MRECVLAACGRTFALRCDDDATGELLASVFDGLLAGAPTPEPVRRFRIAPRAPRGFLLDDGRRSRAFGSADSLIFALDKDITLTLQRERPDLFFLHAAVVGLDGRAVAIAAPPGTGKSTLTLVALARGLDYFSDELAPIDLRRLVVEPYTRALNVKRPPPEPYVLPAGTRRLGHRFHVPVNAMRAAAGPAALAACIFLRRDGERFSGLRDLSAASSVARLMENALNPLAHLGDGLDAATTLARAVPCREVDGTDLDAASRVVGSLFDR